MCFSHMHPIVDHVVGVEVGNDGARVSNSFADWSVYEQQLGSPVFDTLGRASDMQLALNNLNQALVSQQQLQQQVPPMVVLDTVLMAGLIGCRVCKSLRASSIRRTTSSPRT
jgi:hypothetical protein